MPASRELSDLARVEVSFTPRSLEEELSRGADLSIISVVNALVERARTLGASDIHVDPSTDRVRVRMRVDGVLQDICNYPKEIHNEVVSRVKVLAGLRTDEHQATQDGRFRYAPEGGGTPIDMRVSIAPTYHGENIVLRLLADNAAQFTLESLGFSPEDSKKIKDAIAKPHGMILSTGPTGSGKTTTLYTLIKMLNSPEVSIVTIEDPIEYSIEDIEQIQVNSRVGLTFATGLRSVLRQDPDIIMVGEIRDAETAGIAVNTALTGVFGDDTFKAVEAFQVQNGNDVLSPWVGRPDSGITGPTTPTGFVYQTTRWRINNIWCPGSEAFPQTLI